MKKTDHIDITATIGDPLKNYTLTNYNVIDAPIDRSLRLGDEALTEEMLQTLRTLLETISQLPDDNEIKQLFETNMMLNKLRNS